MRTMAPWCSCLHFRSVIVAISMCANFSVSPAVAESGNCAHAALATSLNLLGKQTTEHELIPRFPPPYRGDSPVPMHVLRDVAMKEGVGLTIAKLDPSSPSDAWNSAIFLILTKSGRGHYIVCNKVEQDYVVIVDSETIPKQRAIPIRQLAVLWEGEALIKTRRNPWKIAETALVSVLLSVGIVGLAVLGAKRRVAGRTIAASLLLVNCFLVGCSGSDVGASRLEAPLYFEKPVVVLERILEHGKPYEVRLRLTRSAIATSDAQIESISASCTCLIVEDNTSLILKPGESLDIAVLIDPEGKDVVGGDILVFTSQGELAHCAISGIVATRFRLHTQHVVHRRDGSQENKGNIVVSRTKENGVPIKRPNPSVIKSDTGVELQLVECIDTSIGASAVGGEVVREEHRWSYAIMDGSTGGLIELPYVGLAIEVSVLD